MFDYGFADELLKLAGMDWLDKEVGAHKKRQAVSQFTAPVFGAAGRALKSTAAAFPVGGGAKANPAPPNPGQGKVTAKSMAYSGSSPAAQADRQFMQEARKLDAAKKPASPPMSRAPVRKQQSPLGVSRGGRMGAAQRVLERY